MRILYINDALAIYGGIERILVDKMNMFSKEGYEVFIITANQGNHTIPYYLNPKVVHYDLNICFHQQYYYGGLTRIWKRYNLYRKFRKVLASQIISIKPDIIICTRIDFLNSINKVKGKIPLIFESHSSFLEGRSSNNNQLKVRLKYFYLKNQARKAQVVVTLTKGDLQNWKKINNNVVVIPNIVHLNNSDVYSDCKSKSVIYVGRFSVEKDIESLLRIWKRVYKCHPDWFLHIYGAYGDQYDLLHNEISNINANIIVYQPTPNIIDKYLDYSMLLLTSRIEPFGLVLPEAMSCGLPVVSFDCPYGPADIITDCKDGFLIQNRDEKQFSEKVCWLIEHPEERVKMGKLGVTSSMRYKDENIFPLWVQIFNMLK